uniref:Fibronectin type-III domain-containing protein n=1 Tax=Timema poppense TaxID=170557 RepID=A0A7R9HFD1_TIMPO|nr:unnamed protein product [Timema poppensis]
MHVSVADKMSRPHLLSLLFLCAWLPQLHTSRNANEITHGPHIINSEEASKEKFGLNVPPDEHTTPESITINQTVDHRGTNSSKVSLIIDPIDPHKPKDNEDSKTTYSIAKSLMKRFSVYSLSETSTQTINSNSESTPEHANQSTNQSTQDTSTPSYDTSSETRQSIKITQPTNQSTQDTSTPSYDPSSESSSEYITQPTDQSTEDTSTPSYVPSSESSSEYTSQPTNQSTEDVSTPSYGPSSESSSEYTTQPTNQSTEDVSTPSYGPSSESSSEYITQPTNQSTQDTSTPSYDPSSESSSEYTTQPTDQSTEDVSTPSYGPSSESSSEYTTHPTNQSTEDVSTPSQCAVPGDVTDLNVKDSPEDFSLSVSWQPPYNSDCVMNYSVCWNSASEHSCSTVADTSLVIRQLVACTEYTITVTSIGRVGNSLGVSTTKSSKNVAPLRHTAKEVGVTSGSRRTENHFDRPPRARALQIDIPGPAANLSLLSRSANSLTVNWTEPVANPQCVTNYTLCLNNNSSCWTNIRQTILMIQESVRPCTDYNVTVFALGQAGVSAGSIISGRTLSISEYQTSLAGHCQTVSIRQHLWQDIVHHEYQTTSLAGHCPSVSIRHSLWQDIVHQ